MQSISWHIVGEKQKNVQLTCDEYDDDETDSLFLHFLIYFRSDKSCRAAIDSPSEICTTWNEK